MKFTIDATEANRMLKQAQRAIEEGLLTEREALDGICEQVVVKVEDVTQIRINVGIQIDDGPGEGSQNRPSDPGDL